MSHPPAPAPAAPADAAPLRRSQLVARLRRVRQLYKVRRLPFARWLNAFRGAILVVEGIIGVGKSTLCESVVAVLNEAGVRAEYLPETVDMTLLGAFLARQKELETAQSELDALRAQLGGQEQTAEALRATMRQLASVLVTNSSLFPSEHLRELEAVRAELADLDDADAALRALVEKAVATLAAQRNEHAAPFQFDMQRRRHAASERAKALQAEGVTVVVDRSLVGDYAFALLQHEDGNLSDAEWDTYCDRAEAADILEPDLTYFLNCRPETALARCNTRRRAGEDAYTLAYFRRLTRAYYTCFEAVDAPCLFVDWSVARELDPHSGHLDRAIVLDLLAHGHPVLAPPPVLVPHQNHGHRDTSSAYAQYGCTDRLADVAWVQLGPDAIPRAPGDRHELCVYVPDEDAFAHLVVERVERAKVDTAAR